MPEVNEVKGRVFARAFIVTIVRQGLNHEVRVSMSVRTCARGKGGEANQVGGKAKLLLIYVACLP